MREEDRCLFPLPTIGAVVQLFRHQLTGQREPDLALLSIVAGCVENTMTTPRSGGLPEDASLPCSAGDYEEPEVADVENLRIEPPVELHIVEALYSKFQAVIRGYCDVSLLQEAGSRAATRGLVKRVSDIVWNTLTKSQYKDRPHLQSIYSYLTGSKLDSFGVAMTVVAGCQVLGFSDVHLSLSEDHAWVVFGQQGDQTAEVTWHSKGNEDKRGLPVDREKARDSWLYVGGQPVQCTRHMEVATLVSSINPAMTPAMDCLEVGVLQQELLWLLYDLGHLDHYPMALGNLGDLEEMSASPGRPSSQSLYLQAVAVARRDYGDQHVYPYTYLAGWHFRQRDYRAALRSWADAANVIKRYKYSKDDEEIYKEFMEINNELIPHILKADEELVQDPVCFGSLLQFYDGLCSWEEDSSTPVLHIGWVKPIVKCFAAFDFSVRTRLDISCLQEEGKGGLVSLAGWDVPDRLNNNYKESADDCDRDCDEKTGHYDISLYKDDFIYDLNLNHSHHPRATEDVSFEDFHGMHVSRLVRLAATNETEETFDVSEGCALDSSKQRLLSHYADRAGDSLLNIDFLLGSLDSEPFLASARPWPGPPAPASPRSAPASPAPASPSPACPSTKAASLAEVGGRLPVARLAKNGRVKVTLFSAKIGDLKPLLQCEKLNSSALHLHLTAQSQTDVKKSRLGLETDHPVGGRVKRPRRE